MATSFAEWIDATPIKPVQVLRLGAYYITRNGDRIGPVVKHESAYKWRIDSIVYGYRAEGHNLPEGKFVWRSEDLATPHDSDLMKEVP